MKYENAKIYKIVSDLSDDVYYGSTCLTLEKRLHDHKRNFNSYSSRRSDKWCSSYALIRTGNYKIELVEAIDNCTCLKDIHQRERYYIENNKCVNKLMPNRSEEERRSIRKTCECGINYSAVNEKQHLQSAKHITFMDMKRYNE